MIEINNLKKSYPMGKKKIEVLKGINLHIKEGEFASIMGASGSGKSTLLNVIGILDAFDSGSYSLDKLDINNLSEKKAAYFRNRLLGFVFQSFNLLTFKNAMENVALPMYYQGMSRNKRNKLAKEYLDKVGMLDRATFLPSELSGGQKQRVAIARALITNPKVILADEPTGALDIQSSLEVMNLFTEVNNSGKTVIVVTHENEVAQRTDRIIRISDGVIVESSKTEDTTFQSLKQEDL